MRAHFRGYYPPSSEELKQLWDGGVIVLDTNVLLNMYRYTKETREELLRILSAFSDRLWLPYQVADEYHRQRLSRINDQRKAYDALKRSLAANIAGMRGEIDKYRRHPVIEVSDLNGLLDELDAALKAKIDEHEAKHNELTAFTLHEDGIRDQLTRLYEGRVGEPFDGTELAEVEEEGVRRYAAKVPPGYADKSKGDEKKFGDLILWKQLLKYIANEKKSVIFVTDDTKDDWWLRMDGQTIGPRPELVDEFERTTGQVFHMYRAEQFARYASRASEAEISSVALDEIDHLAVKQEEERRVVEKTRKLLADRYSILDDQISQLRANVARLKDSLDESRDSYAVAVRVSQEAAGQLDSLRTDLQFLDRENAQLAVMRVELEAEVARAVDGKDASRYSIARARLLDVESRIKEIEGRRAAAASSVDQLNDDRSQVEVAHARVERLERAYRRELRRLGEVEREFNELVAALDDGPSDG